MRSAQAGDPEVSTSRTRGSAGPTEHRSSTIDPEVLTPGFDSTTAGREDSSRLAGSPGPATVSVLAPPNPLDPPTTLLVRRPKRGHRQRARPFRSARHPRQDGAPRALKVKADLERELEDLILNARSAASTLLGRRSRRFLPATGRTESPSLTLRLSENANEDRRWGVLVGMPRNTPPVGPARVRAVPP